MKKNRSQLAAFLILAIGIATAQAGTSFYQAIPPTQSDAGSGIGTDNQYTSAVDGGNTHGTDRVINGITLYSLAGNNQTATADNCTLNVLAGNLSNVGGESSTIQADGVFKGALSDMTFNNGATDNSQQEIVLDPESLEVGTTYDLRIYICDSSGQNRQVNLSFVGDGQPPVETGFFNEDDARTSAGGFKDANQAYYINYRFTWDGDSTPGVTITQRSGGAPFVFYALTNQVVPGGSAATGGEGQEGLSVGLVEQGADEVGVTTDDFYGSESLNANGLWVNVERWGKCWQPTNVPNGWRPYTKGTFQQCDDCGWTFVSDEPWAWACYHYGRWLKVNYGCGWVWVPGKVWASSWVSWRKGRDESCSCIGWAPLPPEARCEPGVGISTWVDHTYDIGPDYYTFINIRDFGRESYLGCGCIYEHSRNVTIINETTNITNITYNRFGTYSGGPDYNWCNTEIRKHGGREVEKVYVRRYDDPSKMGGQFSKREGNQLALLSPRVKGEKNPRHDPKVVESLKSDKIDRGWNSIKDRRVEDNLKKTIAQQNQGKNPKNTKATLSPDATQAMTKKHGGKGLAGRMTGGTETAGVSGGQQHPGKGKKGVGAQSLTSGGQAGPGGFNQHAGGKGKGAGQDVAGAGTSLGAGGKTGFNQHPGGKGHEGQNAAGGASAGVAETQTAEVGGGVGKGTTAVGGGQGQQHPGKRKKGVGAQSLTSGGQAGPGGFNQHAGGKGKGAGQDVAGAGTSLEAGGNIQGGQAGGQSAGGGKGHQKGKQTQGQISQGVTQGMQGGIPQGTGGQAGQGGQSGGGSGKGHHKQQQQTQGQTPQEGHGIQGSGPGGTGGQSQGGKGHHKQQKQTQQTQQFPQQGQGGGGGGQGFHKQQQQSNQQQFQQQPQGGKKKGKQTPTPAPH